MCMHAHKRCPNAVGVRGGGGGHRKRALQRPGCFVPTGSLPVHAGRLPGGRWKRTSKGKKLKRAGVQNVHRPEPLLAQLGNRAFSVGWISTRLAAASCLSDLTVPWSRSHWMSHHSDMLTGTNVSSACSVLRAAHLFRWLNLKCSRSSR